MELDTATKAEIFSELSKRYIAVVLITEIYAPGKTDNKKIVIDTDHLWYGGASTIIGMMKRLETRLLHSDYLYGLGGNA